MGKEFCILSSELWATALYIYMQDKNQLDDYEMKKDKTEPFQEQYFPTSYDWRQSNCDEKRSGPCKKVDNVKHKFH
jgi:hypothetical protein